jgi:RNA polymerase sigma-70 factor (ECF subfamily)
MPHLAENRALLDRFRAGDPSAIADVYRHYAPGLARFLKNGFPFEFGGAPGQFRGFRSPLELTECVQEVFARALTQEARLAYDGINPYAGYLAGIARNYLLNEFRRRRNAAAALSGAALDVLPEGVAQPDIDLEETEAARLVSEFTAGLGGGARSVYQARFLEEKTQDAAALALGLTRIQLRRIERRIRIGLFDHLKARGYLEDLSFKGWSLVRGQKASQAKRQS